VKRWVHLFEDRIATVTATGILLRSPRFESKGKKVHVRIRPFPGNWDGSILTVTLKCGPAGTEVVSQAAPSDVVGVTVQFRVRYRRFQPEFVVTRRRHP